MEINVTRSSMPTLDEYVEEIKELWESHWLTNMGTKHRQLQEELKEYMDVDYVDLFTNGHMALELALQSMEFKPGSEVITTPFTFASTTHAIVRNGLNPVFCDINQDDYTIDVTKIEEMITSKTCAIVPVHVYGNICDVHEIQRIAEKYNLKVIYDAAHAFGEMYEGKGIGNYGDVSCFSFHATKVFNTIEGGAVSFKNEDFGRKLYGLKNFGIRNEETIDSVGANAKMNEFCAAMGICNLRHISEEIEKRRSVVERYRGHLEAIHGIKLISEQKDVTPNYSYFPIVIDEKLFGKNRDDVYLHLKENGIIARKYFYPLTNQFACYDKAYAEYPTPIALDIANRVLTLPLYAELPLEKVDEICKIIKEAYGK